MKTKLEKLRHLVHHLQCEIATSQRRPGIQQLWQQAREKLLRLEGKR